MSDYGAENVLCPFFRKNEEYRVKCEGTENENNIHLVFGSKAKKKTFFENVCCCNYKRCRIYKMLMQKYE